MFLDFNEEIFLIKNCFELSPLLTNLPITNQIGNIDKQTVSNILNNNPISSLNQSIILYSVSTLTCYNAQKKIIKNTLGFYKHDNSSADIYHILLTPHLLSKNDFGLSLLPWSSFSYLSMDNVVQGNMKNYLSIPHVMEGIKVQKANPTEKQNDLLNQEFCSCDHDELPAFNPNCLKLYGKPLASKYLQKYLLYENLETVGLLTPKLKSELNVCSLISFLSYDTESLNRNFFEQFDINDNLMFENAFQSHSTNKINLSVQKLYIIGLYDNLPIDRILETLKLYLPMGLFKSLANYMHETPKAGVARKQISWNDFSTILQDKTREPSLTQCSSDLVNLLGNLTLHEDHVKIFHIANNNTPNAIHEPTLANTSKMIEHFFFYIYKRNVLASLVKYIILKSYIKNINDMELNPEKRGIFYLISKRLEEIIFESILVAFNGGNYDNYLICNDLLQIMTKMGQRIKIYKKGASIATIHVRCKQNFIIHKTKKNCKKWLMNLYVKDVRNLVAANMSLDKIGKMLNLNVSKLCFPYDQATSIRILKETNSLNPYKETYWTNSLGKRTVPLDQRLHAQHIFEEKKFSNLYEYGTYYLCRYRE